MRSDVTVDSSIHPHAQCGNFGCIYACTGKPVQVNLPQRHDIYGSSISGCTSLLSCGAAVAKEVIKCKTLPRWIGGTRALDGGCCE
jgi:hypothetical protein